MTREKESILSVPSDSLSNNPFVSGREYSVVADSDGLVRVQVSEGRVRGVIVSESPILCTASLHYVRNGYAYIRLTRLWEHVETHEVAVNTSSFDFNTKFNDLDTEVRLEGYWTYATGTPTLLWRINASNDTTNKSSEWVEQGGTGSTGVAGLQVAEADGAEAAEIKLAAELDITTGRPRMGYSFTADSSGVIKHFAHGFDDTTTEITQLGLRSAGTGLQAGSEFHLYRRPQFNKTKLKLWIY